MWELEVWASAMAWDMDTDNFDLEDDDRKLWVPMMAQTLKTGVAEQDGAIPSMGPVTPARQLTIYAVKENQDGLADQASMPIIMPVLVPQMKGQVVIKANLGQGESPREEEMTTDEDGEREVSEPREPNEAPAMPHAKVSKVKGKTPRVGRACVPKQAEVIVLAKVRTVPCGWCQVKGCKCHS